MKLLLCAFLQLLCVLLPAFVQKPELILQTGHSNSVNSIAFSPDSRLLASASDDNSIKIWDLTSGHLLRTLTEPVFSAKSRTVGTVDKIAFSPDGRVLASSHSSFVVKLWDVEHGRELRRLNGAEGAVAFSPDGRNWLLRWTTKQDFGTLQVDSSKPIPCSPLPGFLLITVPTVVS